MKYLLRQNGGHALATAQRSPLDLTVASQLSGNVMIRLILILAQMGLLWWMVGVYEVESTLGIINIMPLIFGGFIVHSFLPQAYKIHFFLMLGITGIFVLLQWDFALILLGLVLLLFAICILPVAVKYRALLLMLAGATLAWLWGWQKGTVPGDYLIMPIVGSIFMFRASVYLYDQQYEKSPLPLAHRFAYFMMLPNLVFTLFPVVDYKIFKQTYYSAAPIAIYQKGIRWMVRGFFHLMLYRIIYYYCLPGYQEVNDFWTFILFAFTNYLLILRLSGLFHFATGILCLFGWNLPPVFNNYFLASGFSDLWRRINVYWRDYMMKIFYYPIYFRLRKIGKTSGMVLSIWIVFAITWLLHSYQWFWLKGSFPLRLVDGLFWAIFGILVSINSVYQQKAAKRKKGTSKRSPFIHSFIEVSQITAMFIFMCLLWSFWTSPTVPDWLDLISSISTAATYDWLILIAIIAGVLLIGSMVYKPMNSKRVQQVLEPEPANWSNVFWSFSSLIPFVLFLSPACQQSLSSLSNKPMSDLLENKLNAQDQEQMVNGYYEDILITNNLATPLSDLQQKPSDWVPFARTELAKPTNDWRQNELKKSYTGELKGATFSTNHWGMRDKEYKLQKPEGTIRIGILGGSYVVGSGVNDDEVFDSIVESELNEQHFLNRKYELLNFSIPAYHLLNCLYQFDHNASKFQMDGVMLMSHSMDIKRLAPIISRILDDGAKPFPFLKEIMARHQIDSATYNSRSFYWSKPVLNEILRASYKYLADQCKEKGIQPIFVYWPRTEKEEEEDLAFLMATALEMGYLVVDLSAAYENYSVTDIQLAKWDRHPNKLGHKLIAQLLIEKMKTEPRFNGWLQSL